MCVCVCVCVWKALRLREDGLEGDGAVEMAFTGAGGGRFGGGGGVGGVGAAGGAEDGAEGRPVLAVHDDVRDRVGARRQVDEDVAQQVQVGVHGALVDDLDDGDGQVAHHERHEDHQHLGVPRYRFRFRVLALLDFCFFFVLCLFFLFLAYHFRDPPVAAGAAGPATGRRRRRRRRRVGRAVLAHSVLRSAPISITRWPT